MDLNGLMNMGSFAMNMLGGNGLKNLRNLFGGIGKSPIAPSPQQSPPQYQRPWGPIVPGPYGGPGGAHPGMGWGQPGAGQMPGQMPGQGQRPAPAPATPWGFQQQPVRPQMPSAQPGLPSGVGTGQGAQLPSATEGGETTDGNSRGGFGQYMKYLTPENIQQWMQWMQLAQQLFGKGAATGAAAAASALTPASAKMRQKQKRKNRTTAPIPVKGGRRPIVKGKTNRLNAKGRSGSMRKPVRGGKKSR